MIGSPRVHLRETDSTNLRARELALAGAPHGTLVTAGVQSAGRGRQGRVWSAPAGRALLMSVVVRHPPSLLPLVAAVAVADACGDAARIKWPNDVLVHGRKVAGILVEGRPQEGWAIAGIGVNVAVRVSDLPEELHDRAGGLGLEPADVDGVLGSILTALEAWLAKPTAELLDAWRGRDALLGHQITWSRGSGVASGVDDRGRLLVRTADDGTVTLDAGEVHLGALPPT